MPAKPRVANPQVIAFAEKTNLDLSTVHASGPNGTITHEDAVSAHWAKLRPAWATSVGLDASASWAEIKGAVDAKWRPRAVAVGLDPSAPVADIRVREKELAATQAAAITSTADLDPAFQQSLAASSAAGQHAQQRATAARGPAFALNPLVDNIRAQAAAARQPAPAAAPPTLFASGDLPSFTASGIPPQALLDAPWEARHAMAAAPTTAEAYAILNAATDGPEIPGTDNSAYDYESHPGNNDYQSRVAQWQDAAITPEQREAEWEASVDGQHIMRIEAENAARDERAANSFPRPANGGIGA